jgi:hypothetical protein
MSEDKRWPSFKLGDIEVIGPPPRLEYEHALAAISEPAPHYVLAQEPEEQGVTRVQDAAVIEAEAAVIAASYSGSFARLEQEIRRAYSRSPVVQAFYDHIQPFVYGGGPEKIRRMEEEILRSNEMEKGLRPNELWISPYLHRSRGKVDLFRLLYGTTTIMHSRRSGKRMEQQTAVEVFRLLYGGRHTAITIDEFDEIYGHVYTNAGPRHCSIHGLFPGKV